MAESELSNGVYASEEEEAICVVKDEEFVGAKLGNDLGGILWPDIFNRGWLGVGDYTWKEDQLVLPEEYLT